QVQAVEAKEGEEVSFFVNVRAKGLIINRHKGTCSLQEIRQERSMHNDCRNSFAPHIFSVIYIIIQMAQISIPIRNYNTEIHNYEGTISIFLQNINTFVE
ncbi:hypothetical protein ACJX0J_030239, partial [Zea mays]